MHKRVYYCRTQYKLFAWGEDMSRRGFNPEKKTGRDVSDHWIFSIPNRSKINVQCKVIYHRTNLGTQFLWPCQKPYQRELFSAELSSELQTLYPARGHFKVGLRRYWDVGQSERHGEPSRIPRGGNGTANFCPPLGSRSRRLWRLLPPHIRSSL
jgi:hypothetical protein